MFQPLVEIAQPKQIQLHQLKSKDRYGYLLQDPRTLFAGAPSSFLRDTDSNYVSKLRKKALQIGVRPENISHPQEGHTITRTEFMKQRDFFSVQANIYRDSGIRYPGCVMFLPVKENEPFDFIGAYIQTIRIFRTLNIKR